MERKLFSTDSADGLAARISALSPEQRRLVTEKLKHPAVEGHLLVARTLRELGVTHAYAVSGTPTAETFARCAGAGIQPIGVRHQQAAVMMAAAQNYVTGKLVAVALLSAGPGVTNAATGILVAHDNCWPVVVLGGRRPLSMRGMGSFQELDAVPVFQPITKWAAVVESTSSLRGCLERACRTALSGRPGAVYLDMPEDVLTGTAPVHRSSLLLPEPPAPDSKSIERAAGIILHARRPGLVIGKGLRWSEPYEELRKLVEDFGIPFITSPMGRGAVADDHPLCSNPARGFFQANADVILLVGARLDWTFRFGSEFAPDAKLIRIDIHEPEISVNVKPAIGIVGDAKQVLRELLVCLERKRGEAAPEERTEWHAVLAEQCRNKERHWCGKMADDSVPMSPYRMLKEIRDFLPRDAVCVLDGNVFMAAAQQVLPSYLPALRLTAGSNGCMGVGIPFGIGAKLSHPERVVLVICGDGAFGFNAMEMETAIRHGIAVIVVVVNNEGISGALIQRALYPPDYPRVTMFQPRIPYQEIMRAFGGHAEHVAAPAELKPALERALASGKAACIDVEVDPAAPYPND
jgi:2-hydroxyacyl-CoA lyase 1